MVLGDIVRVTPLCDYWLDYRHGRFMVTGLRLLDHPRRVDVTITEVDSAGRSIDGGTDGFTERELEVVNPEPAAQL